ncbi:MAG: ATP-binding protein [Caulobacteraceae bacterium]
MFRSLRTKLTVLYASLFAAILLVTSLVTYGAVSDNATRVVERELTTSGTVFDRVWALRTAQLQNGAGLLSRDFGFREAVATHDAATIRSALDNLKERLGIDLAVVIGVDGRMTGAGESLLGGLRPDALGSIETDGGASGVVVLGGTPYELVSAPVDAPTTMGWVVFATKLDRAQMKSVEDMAGAPLNASILLRQPAGEWRAAGDRRLDPRSSAATRFINGALRSASRSPRRLDDESGAAMALVKPLAALDPSQSIVLLIRYSIARAMAPYRVLFALLLATSLAGLAAVLVGARILARSLTKPILALEHAALRMGRGELIEVAVETADEIGRLAGGFNRMVAEIGQRDAERASAAEALERARDQAEAANRAKSSFLANMSHEVRTPLNGVLGVAGVLANSSLDQEQKRMVEIIQNSADVLRRVLDDVLDLARVEAGHMEIVEDVFDLGEAIHAVASSTDILCKVKGLRFSLKMDTPAGQMVRGDRLRIAQVLGNLLGNALKFTADGEITLKVSVLGAERSKYAFEVRDTGIGFDPVIQESLFQPFQQADGSITRRFSGTGLGLSISRELARAMGGDLTAHGVLGAGATFTLTLTLADCGLATANPVPAIDDRTQYASQPSATLAEQPIRILLADDHETNRTVVRLILTSIGVDLVSAENGEEAVAVFKSDPFDLVLMDMQMPVMDGLTAIGLMRAYERDCGRPRTPILVLSANALPEHVQAAAAAGADGHVAKPITPPILIGAIEETLAESAEEMNGLQVA